MCETNPEPVCVSKLGTDQTPRRAHPSTEIRLYSILILAFTASRLLYYSAGVGYAPRPLQASCQIIEPDLPQSRLIESLYYFHVQPPGFNLWIGLILKLFPTAY